MRIGRYNLNNTICNFRDCYLPSEDIYVFLFNDLMDFLELRISSKDSYAFKILKNQGLIRKFKKFLSDSNIFVKNAVDLFLNKDLKRFEQIKGFLPMWYLNGLTHNVDNLRLQRLIERFIICNFRITDKIEEHIIRDYEGV